MQRTHKDLLISIIVLILAFFVLTNINCRSSKTRNIYYPDPEIPLGEIYVQQFLDILEPLDLMIFMRYGGIIESHNYLDRLRRSTYPKIMKMYEWTKEGGAKYEVKFNKRTKEYTAYLVFRGVKAFSFFFTK